MSSEASIPQRKCRVCGEFKPETLEFFQKTKSKSGKFYFHWRCRKCDSVAALERHYANRDAKLEYMRQYHRDVRMPRDGEKLREYHRQYRVVNPEKVSQRKHASYEKNKPHYLARGYEWREQNYERMQEAARARLEANPEISRSASSKRRAHKRNAPGTHTTKELRELRFQQDERCGYCGIPLAFGKSGDAHLDHMIPLHRGGSNSIDNLVYCCQVCNLNKHHKTFEEWAAWRGW